MVPSSCLQVGGVSALEVNRLELEMLRLLDYRLHVSGEELRAVMKQLLAGSVVIGLGEVGKGVTGLGRIERAWYVVGVCEGRVCVCMRVREQGCRGGCICLEGGRSGRASAWKVVDASYVVAGEAFPFNAFTPTCQLTPSDNARI